MRETGVVKKIVGRVMDVAMEHVKPEQCEQCGACEMFASGKEALLRVPRVEGVGVGDRVEVEVPEASPWLGIVLVLGLPVTLMAVGLVVGSRWTWWVDLLGIPADLAGAALGLSLGVLAFLAARQVDRRYFHRIIVRRVERDRVEDTQE
jgi:positive regulator of sigma E activity